MPHSIDICDMAGGLILFSDNMAILLTFLLENNRIKP